MEIEETTQETNQEPIEAAPPPEPPKLETSEPEADEDEIEDEIVVAIGAEPTPPAPEAEEKDPKLVNKLRKLLREQERKVREYESKMKATAPVENRPPALGPKPKLEDLDYDAEKYEAALADWFEKKRGADEHATRLRKAEEEQQQAWQTRLQSYAKAKASLRVRDYEDAEANVTQTLDVTQQGIIVSGCENPALLTYAIGKDAAKLKELAAIKDPVRFAFAVSKLETQLRTMPRKPPAPETPIKGAAPGGDHVSRTLERLREGVADGSVPMSKLLEFKKSHNIRV